MSVEKVRAYLTPYGVAQRIRELEVSSATVELAAAALGVDSCWINFFDPAVLARDLGLPEHEEILMLLDLGYAAPGFKPLPNHTSRKPLSDTVSYL